MTRNNGNILRPPATDAGTTPNLHWSFADSHIGLDPYADATLTQWLARTLHERPHELVEAHLRLDRPLVDALPTDKRAIVPGSPSTTTIAGSQENGR